MSTSLPLRTRLAALACAAALALPLAPVGAPTASAGDLAQVVSADERLAPSGEQATISAGHIDLGALIRDGQAFFMARDDSGEQPVWRELDDVVFAVSDAAAQPLPKNKNYSFVGAKPGENVWVIPQTEIAGVPWLGWNTQSPSLLEVADRGVWLEYLGHQGPGEFSLFLQNGGFEAPQVLFASAGGGEERIWVDLNTHTHANWTFTRPGTHLVGLRLHVDTLDGQHLTADTTLRLAVGATDPQQARAHQWDADAAGASASSGTLWWALGAVAAVVLGAVVLVVRRRA
ncbi:choice-of-anchor M domain-containing protein [Corynebacterium lizhenjunii]|uniref:choice-of-anchor M domain-containing protein n=1 Tax=Corynebacterium lizhenjunii TaxID=2709394 RepID=UPI0013EC1945|nr:choice-of-anchor M domain-containing protein [Corynebacterium lizhenjunii]